ncbi:MAG: hypothetical protein JKY52_04985 [Flavobacteriales bacterium]|nr:hypothetical protein [Flavobacteriales bacterium]
MKAILFLIVLICSSVCTIAQDANKYQDTLITKGRDTIVCKITEIKNARIYYTYRFKKSKKSTHMPMSDVHQYTRDGKTIEYAKALREKFNLVEKVSAAEGKLLNNKFKFKDGIYIQYADFITNSPSYSMDDFKYSQLPGISNANILYLKSIEVRQAENDFKKISADSIWGMCINGKPYINKLKMGRLPGKFNGGTLRSTMTFVRIGMLGPICHLYLYSDSDFSNDVEAVTASGIILSPNYQDKQINQRMLKFKTGEVLEFNYENLKVFFYDDRALLSELSKEKKKKAPLLGYLIKYNNRNPIYVRE